MVPNNDLSGDGDVCMQANAHEQMGQLLPREKHKHAYEEALKERYKNLPEVKRILRHRHLPTEIYKVCPPCMHGHPGVSIYIPASVFCFHSFYSSDLQHNGSTNACMLHNTSPRTPSSMEL